MMDKEEIKAKLDEHIKALGELIEAIAELEKVGSVEMRLQVVNILGITNIQSNVSLGEVRDKEGNLITRDNLEEQLHKFAEKMGMPMPEKPVDAKAFNADDALKDILGKRKDAGAN